LAGELHIVELSRGRRDLNRFIRVAHGLYRADPNWVAPLTSDLRKVLGDANPFYEHADAQFWVAARGGRDVGRIAGIVDRVHNDYHKEHTAFWGFFECEDDAEVAASLFKAVNDWARGRGTDRLLGPMNPSSNDECGLLVEGFDSAPVFMMTYNPPYYARLVEGAGYGKAKDLLAYHFRISAEPQARMERLAAAARRRLPEVTFRSVRIKELAADLVKVKEVYNSAWEANWGFAPMTDGDLQFMAGRLKPLLVPQLAWLAETAHEAVGFMMSMPDYNQALKPLRGRLMSPWLFWALPYLLRWKPTRFVRVVTLGIKKAWRQRGIDAVLFAESLKHSLATGYADCEVSWLLEDNEMVIRPIQVFGGALYKRYRLYEKPVG
jgi:hypothetical protein